MIPTSSCPNFTLTFFSGFNATTFNCQVKKGLPFLGLGISALHRNWIVWNRLDYLAVVINILFQASKNDMCLTTCFLFREIISYLRGHRPQKQGSICHRHQDQEGDSLPWFSLLPYSPSRSWLFFRKAQWPK